MPSYTIEQIAGYINKGIARENALLKQQVKSLGGTQRPRGDKAGRTSTKGGPKKKGTPKKKASSEQTVSL